MKLCSVTLYEIQKYFYKYTDYFNKLTPIKLFFGSAPDPLNELDRRLNGA